MPVTVTVDPDANLVTYTATGDLTLDEMMKAYASVPSQPGFRKGMNALCDGKNAKLKLGLAEVKQLVGFLEELRRDRGSGYKVALLVRSNEDFGLTTIFGMQTITLPIKVKVFRSSTEAREWLASEED